MIYEFHPAEPLVPDKRSLPRYAYRAGHEHAKQVQYANPGVKVTVQRFVGVFRQQPSVLHVVSRAPAGRATVPSKSAAPFALPALATAEVEHKTEEIKSFRPNKPADNFARADFNVKRSKS